MSQKPTFERTADATLDETRAIYSQRGGEYADSWALHNLVDTLTRSILSKFGITLNGEQTRLLQLAVLCDVKDQRIGAGGPHKKDSWVDGLAYRASLATLLDEYEQARPPNTEPKLSFADFYDRCIK